MHENNLDIRMCAMADHLNGLVVLITNATFNNTDRWSYVMNEIKMNLQVLRPDSDSLPQLIDDAEFNMICLNNADEID
jgi:hypothetical protein